MFSIIDFAFSLGIYSNNEILGVTKFWIIQKGVLSTIWLLNEFLPTLAFATEIGLSWNPPLIPIIVIKNKKGINKKKNHLGKSILYLSNV